MAYKLIWSPAARDDLHDITIFIARDDSDRAMSFGYQLISETDLYKVFQSWVALCLSTGMRALERSSFRHIESYIESIMDRRSVRLCAFGIRPEEYHSCKRT
jgi:hypothetical protein